MIRIFYILLSLDIRQFYSYTVHSDISPSLFSHTNSRETPIARPLGRGMGVFREIIV